MTHDLADRCHAMRNALLLTCMAAGSCVQITPEASSQASSSAPMETQSPEGHPPSEPAQAEDEAPVSTRPMSQANASQMTSRPSAPIAGSDATNGVAGASGIGDTSGLALGLACTEDDECASLKCVKNTCCAVRECGVCQVCGSEGRCVYVTDATEPTCTDGLVCGPGSHCGFPNGRKCSSPDGCASRLCDDLCCASRCGVCEVCSADGSCQPLVFGDDYGACEGSRSCSGGSCVEVDPGNNQDKGPYEALGTGARIAQTLTIANAGTIVEFRMYTDCAFGTWTVRTVGTDGLPTQVNLAMVGSMRHEPSSNHREVLVNLLVSLSVDAGDQLALVAESPISVACQAAMTHGDANAGGAFYRLRDDAWEPDEGDDLIVDVLMRR